MILVLHGCFWKQYVYTLIALEMVLTMGKTRQCAICGAANGCGMVVMGQYICLDCQILLDDPKRRVFGCAQNRRFAKSKQDKSLVLAKAKD